MKFPFHISAVAVAYNQSSPAGRKDMPLLIRPSSRLSISFDETGKPREEVPSLSPGMTAATSEFVLSKILETISTEDYRYIGIIASDTRDTIFLAGLIKQYCPDVQLFAPSGDLLLGHPRYAKDLRGMVVGSTYPLFSMAQRWDAPHEGDHHRNLFPNQSEQGSYNAAVSLLDPDSSFKSLYDYGVPFDELDDLTLFWKSKVGSEAWTEKSDWCRRTKKTSRPAIWINVIGQRGLWPVKYMPDYSVKGSRYTYGAPNRGRFSSDRFLRQFSPLLPQFTWHWGSLFIAMCFFAWVIFWYHTDMTTA